MSVRYVTTTHKRSSLIKAQLDTCLVHQDVDVLDDRDALDCELRLLSNGRKMLRWFVEQREFAPFTFVVDDDAWIFTKNVDRVCAQLDSSKPFMSLYRCAPWGNKGAMTRLWGNTEFPVKTQEFWRAKTGFTVTWHGGAGLLLTRKMAELVQEAILSDDMYKEAIDVLHSVTSTSQGADANWPWCLPQDLLMLRAFSLAVVNNGLAKDCVRSIESPALNKLKEPSSHPWSSLGTNFPERLNQAATKLETSQKCCADLNPAYPVLPGTKDTLDAKQAVALSLVTEPDDTRQNAHVLKAQANMLTLHRIKKAEQFYVLDEVSKGI